MLQHQLLQKSGPCLGTSAAAGDKLRRLRRIPQTAVRTDPVTDLPIAHRSRKKIADRKLPRTAVVERHPFRQSQKRVRKVRRIVAQRINLAKFRELRTVGDLHDVSAAQKGALPERDVDPGSGFDLSAQFFRNAIVEKPVKRKIQCDAGDSSGHGQSIASRRSTSS